MSLDISEKLRINRLLDFYGRLLTDAQLEIMKDYYELDLSLSEISEIRNISRTAVSDALKQGREKLDKTEEKLGFCKVFDSLKEEKTDEKAKIIEQIEEMIKNGI